MSTVPNSAVNSAFHKGNTRLAVLALTGLLIAFLALFPLATPFICDEPNLLHAALDANAADAWATHGLAGSKSVHYGPVSVWFYQLLLDITPELSQLVVIRVALFAGACMLAARSLTRTTGLKLTPFFIAMLSPYFFLYARQLWDNTLILPVSLLTFAGYAKFLHRRSNSGLTGTLIGCGMLMLIHPMCVGIVAAILLQLLLGFRRDVREHWLVVLFCATLLTLVAWPYLKFLRTETVHDVTGASGLGGWWLALSSFRLTGATNLGYFFEGRWPSVRPAGWAILATLSALSIVPLLKGVLRSLLAMGRKVALLAPDQALARAALLAIVFQIPCYGLSHTYGHPHHLIPLWAPSLILIATGLQTSRPGPARRGLIFLWFLGNLLATTWLMRYLVEHPATDAPRIGVTLDEQMRVVDNLLSQPAGTRLETDIAQFRQFPQSLEFIRRLRGLAPADPASSSLLRIHFAPNSPTLLIEHESDPTHLVQPAF